MAAYCIPWTIMQYKTFWNDGHKKLGYPLGPQMVNADSICLSYGRIVRGHTHQALCYLGLANGVLMLLSPQSTCNAYERIWI